MGDGLTGENDRTSLHLPAFTPVESLHFCWGDIEGGDFAETIRAAYYEVTQWRRNVFLVPSGKAGKEFVHEVTRLISSYAQGTALESVSLYAVMTACVLLLQKPFHTLKTRDHVLELERRLKAWNAGDINGLMREGRAIQTHLSLNKRAFIEKDAVARTFAKLMMAGNVKAALRYLSDNHDMVLLSLDEQSAEGMTVREALKSETSSARRS